MRSCPNGNNFFENKKGYAKKPVLFIPEKLSLRLFLGSFWFAFCGFAAGANEVFEFGHKFGHVFELEINGGESNVSDLIKLFQPLHDYLAEIAGRKFAVGRVLNILLYFVDDRFKLRGRDRTFFAGAHQAAQDLSAVKNFASAVFFDDHIRNFVDALVGRKAAPAFETLAAAANRIAVFRLARINDLVFQKSAKWTLHKIVDSE